MRGTLHFKAGGRAGRRIHYEFTFLISFPPSRSYAYAHQEVDVVRNSISGKLGSSSQLQQQPPIWELHFRLLIFAL